MNYCFRGWSCATGIFLSVWILFSLIPLQEINLPKNVMNTCFLLYYWLIFPSLCLFTSFPVYRWVRAEVNKTKNRNDLPKGQWGFARSAANWTNWPVHLRNVEGHGREERTRCICRRGVDPCFRTYATSHSEWCSCGVSNLPTKVYGLTSITISDADITYASQDLTRL